MSPVYPVYFISSTRFSLNCSTVISPLFCGSIACFATNSSNTLSRMIATTHSTILVCLSSSSSTSMPSSHCMVSFILHLIYETPRLYIEKIGIINPNPCHASFKALMYACFISSLPLLFESLTLMPMIHFPGVVPMVARSNGSIISSNSQNTISQYMTVSKESPVLTLNPIFNMAFPIKVTMVVSTILAKKRLAGYGQVFSPLFIRSLAPIFVVYVPYPGDHPCQLPEPIFESP